jgi:hypothetical protein
VEELLRPICTAWKSKIDAAIQHRKDWVAVADQCELFYAASSGFMWDTKHRSRLGLPDYAPNFKMTIAKAFELVALFGPSLYWRNPIRTLKKRSRIMLTPENVQFLNPVEQMQAPMIAQMGMQEEQAIEQTRQLVSAWLNYTPDENVGGGLKSHSQLAITDALVKGRGCMTVEPYSYPGSDRLLTGAFYLHPYDLVIDPDADNVWDAKWIAIRCRHPVWEVEKKYQAQPGEFKKYADSSTYNGVAESGGGVHNSDGHRVVGASYDSMTYWKVYSKGGIGVRLSGADSKDPTLKILDEAIGDFAYIVVPDTANSAPLNCPDSVLLSADVEELKTRFAWPIPFYKDGKWPVAILDFYPRPGSVWPVAPLQPGLGELMFLNVMMSHLCNRIVSSARDFVQCPMALKEEVERVMTELKDLGVFGVTQEFDKADVIKFITQPQVNMDVWRIIDQVSLMFDKRTGLSELMYGNNPGAASRTAEDAAIKRQSLSVRPDYFASQVEEWQSNVASMENLCTQVFIKPSDVEPVLGWTGARLWESLIMTRPIEEVLRDTQMTIEAGSARKPNKDRDVANIGQFAQMAMPFFQQFAMQSGNPEPLNAFLMKWGEANDMEVHDMLIPMPPPPPPMPPPGEVPPEEQPIPQGAAA